MEDDSPVSMTTIVKGQLLRLGGGHQVAIYKRNGACWVAEFHDDRGELFDAASWFHFHAGSLRYSHENRAEALESATAITPEVTAQIDLLHRRAKRAARLPIGEAVLSALRRWAGLGPSRSMRAKGLG